LVSVNDPDPPVTLTNDTVVNVFPLSVAVPENARLEPVTVNE
jgi:hypothetical protein